MEMTDIGECEQCKIQEWKSTPKQTGGFCMDCYEYLKARDMSREEKIRRREENGYFQQTGKYKGKR